MLLSSFVLLGLGSLLGDYAECMSLLLVGRGVQGLGAGGLVLQAYAAYVDMEHTNNATQFFRGITCCTSLGTVSGPFVGALLGASDTWVRTSFLLFFGCKTSYLLLPSDGSFVGPLLCVLL